MRQVKRNFEQKIAHDSTRTPKRFWYFIRGKLKTESGVSPLLMNADDKESMKFSGVLAAGSLTILLIPKVSEFEVW